jgi:leucyl-tRNA synthetase
VYNLFTTCEIKDSAEYITPHLDIAFNQFVKNATNNMEQLKHNVAISDMMVYINECYVDKIIYKEHMLGFLVILSCFAPHLAEELNNIVLNNNKSITKYS